MIHYSIHELMRPGFIIKIGKRKVQIGTESEF